MGTHPSFRIHGPGILRNTVDKREVHTLLECFLDWYCFCSGFWILEANGDLSLICHRWKCTKISFTKHVQHLHSISRKVLQKNIKMNQWKFHKALAFLRFLLFKVPQPTRKTCSITFGIRCWVFLCRHKNHSYTSRYETTFHNKFILNLNFVKQQRTLQNIWPTQILCSKVATTSDLFMNNFMVLKTHIVSRLLKVEKSYMMWC